MMLNETPTEKHTAALDPRDRLILALYAELKAERETREALADAIRHGVVSRDVLFAIASDPVPVATAADIIEIEAAIAFEARRERTRLAPDETRR